MAVSRSVFYHRINDLQLQQTTTTILCNNKQRARAVINISSPHVPGPLNVYYVGTYNTVVYYGQFCPEVRTYYGNSIREFIITWPLFDS